MCRLVGIDTNFNTEIKVADIKAVYIMNIMEKAVICQNIRSIYLFGSVLKEECEQESDIDLLVVSDVTRSKLYKTKSFQRFMVKLHDRDDYFQQYDVICVHGMNELEKNKNKIVLYNEILTNGMELYRRGG